MDRFLVPPPLGRGTALARRRPSGRWVLGFLLLLLVASLLAVPASPAGASAAFPVRSSAPSLAHAAVQPAAVTHGDLVVGPSNSPYVIAPGSSSHQTYYQGGNVTVLPGGQLYIKQTTFEFVQYIGTTGTIGNRLGHLYTFNDQGSVWVQSSTITADLAVLNAYAKVSINVTAPGQMYVNSSGLQFAGAVSVYGLGAALWVNSSTLGRNPDNLELPNATNPANTATTNDSLYGPTLAVTGGGRLTLGASTESATYADNWSLSGSPQPNPLTDSFAASISSSQSGTFSAFTTASDPTSLLQDTLYRTVTAGSITIGYNATVDEQATTNSITYTGTTSLGTIVYGAADTQVTVALPAAAISEINALGVPAFFAAASSGGVSVSLGTTNSATPVALTLIQVNLVAGTSFNITVSGSGSTLTAVDSTLGINWYPVAPFPRPPTAPPVSQPWLSNKVIVSNGAHAFLGDLTTVVAPNPQNVTDISAVLPDASSQAYFYRWMDIPVYGAGNQPVAGGSAVAYYAYDNNQANNATATALNNLATADPDLAGYVAAWDAQNDVSTYGGTNPLTGTASLLLLAGNLSYSTLQDGQFLGDYHVVVTVAGGRAGPPTWFTGSVSPYPTNMNPATGDVQAPTVFPLYRPALGASVASVTVGAANATLNTNNTLAIGESTNFTVTISNIGTGAVALYNVTLEATPSKPGQNGTVLGAKNGTTPLAVGANLSFVFPWVVNETVTGIPHPPINQTFLAIVLWNQGIAPIGGLVEASVNKTIEPSYISLSFTGPVGQLTAGANYVGSVTLLFAGNQSAYLNVTAIGTAGDYALSTQSTVSGTGLTVELFLPSSMANGQYSVQVTAYHQGRTASKNVTDEFSIGPPASAAPTFWNQKIFGLIPLWLLLVIIVAAIVAVIGLLFFFQRQAKGKLVECGECGNLIPEDATTCPKCGAEFEVDLVRCSRCGSTIPSKSEVCPECAAQLLGKGELETSDPERQGYSDYVGRFRGEAKKELGENYGEGAFWDWWKRQPTYLPYSQWKVQQSQGSRAGMGAPPEDAATEAPGPQAVSTPTTAPPPKKGGGAGGASAPPPAARSPASKAVPTAAAPAPTPTTASANAPATPPATPAGGAGQAPMKACSNCGKEIPPEYLVCPFCGAVTQ
ncbi:MAG: zinc ribbon domain-containing protein [Thermoplasmata archaeon]|nr:zinc ribbon domain-containing protein [Thermoplasmata archaeon]